MSSVGPYSSSETPDAKGWLRQVVADWTWQGGGDPRKRTHRTSLEAQGWSAGVTEQPGQEQKVGARFQYCSGLNGQQGCSTIRPQQKEETRKQNSRS